MKLFSINYRSGLTSTHRAPYLQPALLSRSTVAISITLKGNTSFACDYNVHLIQRLWLKAGKTYPWHF